MNFGFLARFGVVCTMVNMLIDQLVNTILKYPLVTELPFRLTGQVEWHEFAPVTFLLVQALMPQHILEVGTTVGDSYLAICQAVQHSKRSTSCRCVPDKIHTVDQSRVFQEFRSYHDSRYETFSKLQDTCVVNQLSPDLLKYDLVHIVSPDSAEGLENLCRQALGQLNTSGVVLISGWARIGIEPLQIALSKHNLYAVRTLGTDHQLAISARGRLIGLIREFLHSTPEDFAAAKRLLGALGERVTAHVEKEMQSGLVALARAEKEEIQKRLAVAEESEIDAQIRHGQKDVLLALARAEKEEIQKRLAVADPGLESAPSIPASQQSGLACQGNSNPILADLHQRYCGKLPPPATTAQEAWDMCGRNILASVLSGQTRLRFNNPLLPKVSVIVVLRNKAHLSILALCALLLQSDIDYELILVDNASSDDTPELLSLVDCKGIIRNEDNRGLGPGVMQAAPLASGEFLCLLNNDALVEKGALAALAGVFCNRSTTGAAGGKILLADGRLQEAGCIIWRDGRTHQYGRGDDANLPQYNFRRPVDYCSGAFLATPRSLFTQLGGLDQCYGMGYYEDVDYCSKVWDAGKSVLYEPRAILYHYEGASSSNQVARLQLVLRNHDQFTSRWKPMLRLHEVERPGNVLRARVASVPGMQRFLYLVDSWGMPFLRSELAHRQQGTDKCSVTYLYLDRDWVKGGGHRDRSSVDVEQCWLGTMSRDDLAAYFAASDVIVVASRESSVEAVKSLLQDHASKVSRVSAMILPKKGGVSA